MAVEQAMEPWKKMHRQCLGNMDFYGVLTMPSKTLGGIDVG
jgi:hypothetical protein